MSESLQAEQCIYFGLDFAGSDCVKTIVKEFGPKGYAILNAILIFIERRGIGLPYNDEFKKEVCEHLHDIGENLVDMVVQRMIKGGFLDRDLFCEKHVLAPPAEYICTMEEFTASVVKHKPFVFIKLGNRNTYDIINSEETIIYSEKTNVSNTETHSIIAKIDSNIGIKENK